VDSLRVRCVPVVRSLRRRGTCAVSPHPGVRGFPTLRLRRPSRLPRKASALHPALAVLLPPSFASFLGSPVFTMSDADTMREVACCWESLPLCAASEMGHRVGQVSL
jgi:hypothetical protein